MPYACGRLSGPLKALFVSLGLYSLHPFFYLAFCFKPLYRARSQWLADFILKLLSFTFHLH